jgi:hypothetical protein
VIVGPYELSKAKQAMKTSKNDGKEEAVVVRRGVLVSVGEGGEIGTRQCVFAGNRCRSEFFTAGEGFRDERVTTDFANVGEKRFKLAAYAREIGLNGLWFDVVAHEDDEETEGVGGWFNGEGVEGAEADVRMKGGGVRGEGSGLKGISEGNGTFVFQSINGPGSTNWLPGLSSGKVHCMVAPSDK